MVPKITHLQFLVIRILGAKQRLGREIREELAQEGESRSLPSFYEMMARMEKDGLVEGSDRIAVKAQSGAERRYRATEAGIKRANEAHDFYASRPDNIARRYLGKTHRRKPRPNKDSHPDLF